MSSPGSLDRAVEGGPLSHLALANSGSPELVERLLHLATVGSMLPTVLHELRNPLASIMMTVEVLLEDPAAEALATDLHVVLAELRRLELSFEGLGAVGRPLRSERHFALDEGLRTAFRLLRGRFEHAGVRARCLVPDMPLLPFDLAVVRTIAFNLCNNAIDACSPGEEVELRAGFDRSQGFFSLEVRDTGAGMQPDVLAGATEMFFTTKESGSGLGLPLVKQVVESGGGSLEISSQTGQGTHVTITLPLSG